MKKSIQIAWLIAFAVFVVANLIVTAQLIMDMCHSGLMFTYLNWCRTVWNYIATNMPIYKALFVGWIFFLITVFFVTKDSSDAEESY